MRHVIARLPELLSVFDWADALTVFVIYAVIDAMYAWYTLTVTDRKALASANISFVMHFLLACGVISYTSNALYVIPLACGSWLGTFLVVRGSRKGRAPATLAGEPEHLEQ